MSSESVIQLGSCRYDMNKQRLFDAEGQELKLRPQSLAVLDLLSSDPGEVFSKDQIFQVVWPDAIVTDDSLVQCIGDIRRVLGDKKHNILQTVPRRGYKLVTSLVPDADSQSEQRLTPVPVMSWRYLTQRPSIALLIGLIVIGLASFILRSQPEQTVSAYQQPPASDNDGHTPTLSVSLATDAATDKSEHLAALQQEIQVAFGRYSSVQLTDSAAAHYQLLLDEHALGDKTSDSQITLQLKYPRDASTIFTESYPLEDADKAVSKLAIRAAAAVASPGVGAIGRHLLQSSQLKPVEELTPAECYAYGYDCTKCSGEEDNIDFRAKVCIANLLEKNPNDAKAWALQSTLYSHQYLFGTTLKEPERSSLPLRKALPQKAIDAATKAESLSNGDDSAIYWGLAQAYYTACHADKMQAAIERGLAINPDDPNLLATFGNWLQYSGRWEAGEALTQRAFDIEPQKYKKWWWMGTAKAHYARGEHEQAYQVFLKSFNERNWLSHLQIAYTLPYLGRIEEAKAAIKDLHRLLPGFTIENALEFYRMFCFDDTFLQKMRKGLLQAGMPSRGHYSEDLKTIEPVRAKTMKVNDITVEFTDVGEGEPIVFVHGSVSDYRSWGHYLLPISENHRYIAYSQRYFGSQPWLDNGENWSVDTFANDLVSFVEALDIGRVHLVSWSSGVTMANVAAVNRPDLFKSIVHYEPVRNDIMAGDSEAEAEAEAPMKAWFSLWKPLYEHLKTDNHNAAVEVMIQNVFELAPGEYANETEATKELARYNGRTLSLRFGEMNKGGTKMTCDYLGGIKTPTLIVLGEQTHKYWELMSKKFAACTPDAELKILQGINHKGPLVKVKEFSDLIINFVGEHR